MAGKVQRGDVDNRTDFLYDGLSGWLGLLLVLICVVAGIVVWNLLPSWCHVI
jgi:hypothetical protein